MQKPRSGGAFVCASVSVTPLTARGKATCECRDVKNVRGQDMANFMGHFRKLTIATSMLVLCAIALATRASAAGFDGEWSVQIESSSSACGGGASVAIG